MSEITTEIRAENLLLIWAHYTTGASELGWASGTAPKYVILHQTKLGLVETVRLNDGTIESWTYNSTPFRRVASEPER